MKKRKLPKIFSVYFILTYLMCTNLVYGADLKVGIKPVESKSINLEDIINPGESKSVPFRLVNLSGDDINIKLELAGIKGSFEGQAEFDLTQKYKILEYISLSQNSLLLKKSERTDFNLLVSVPKESDPGEFLGGILVKNNDTGEVLGESKVNLLVNGDLERKINADFSVVAQNDKPKAKIKLTNQGNTKIEGIRIDYSLKNLKFQNIISSERSYMYTSAITILPGDTQEIEHDLDINLDPLGDYEIKAVLNYGGLEPIFYSDNFSYTSKKKMAVFGVVGSVVFIIFSSSFFFFIRWFIRKRKQIKTINKKWDSVVSGLISGDYSAGNNFVNRIHEEDLNFLVSSIREEVRKTFRDEIRTLKISSNYSSNKSKVAKLPSSRVTSII